MRTVEQLNAALKDRQDYRQTLIQRQEDNETKIGAVETQITHLKKQIVDATTKEEPVAKS